MSTVIFRIPKHIKLPADEEIVSTVEKYHNQDFYRLNQKIRELQTNIEQKKKYAKALIQRANKFKTYRTQMENIKKLCL
jgi:hypothetical protein